MFKAIVIACLLVGCTTVPANPTPVPVAKPDVARTITLAGITQNEVEYVATERARIERNGAGLVCGPGVEAADGLLKGASDWPRARELLLGLCAEYH